MAKKKKESTGLLMAITPVTIKEEKKKGGLLSSDRQGYQEGEEVKESKISDFEEMILREELGEYLRITQEKYRQRYFPEKNKNYTEKATRLHIFHIPDQQTLDEMVESYKRDEGIHYTRPAGDKPNSKRRIKASIPSSRFDDILQKEISWREVKANGGLLSSDRQRYQEGSEVPVPSDPSDYVYNPDYQFDEGLDAGPPVELKEQAERQDTLIQNINSFVQDTAILARDPSYSKIPSRWAILDRSLYRQGISPLEDRVNSAWTIMRDTAIREGIDLIDLPVKNEQELKELIERISSEMVEEEITNREPKQEGGLLTESTVEQPIAIEEPIPLEEPMVMEQSAVPDEQMEDNYLDFVISQSLDDEEEVYLMDKLEADPQLSIIFDKLIGTATEFSGSGSVDGPGSEVSDSIPARLSDGEFVLTAKATDELGSDNVQAMMNQAETRADERQMAQTGGVIRPDLSDEEEVDYLSRPQDEEIRKGMLSINPLLQQRR